MVCTFSSTHGLQKSLPPFAKKNSSKNKKKLCSFIIQFNTWFAEIERKDLSLASRYSFIKSVKIVFRIPLIIGEYIDKALRSKGREGNTLTKHYGQSLPAIGKAMEHIQFLIFSKRVPYLEYLWCLLKCGTLIFRLPLGCIGFKTIVTLFPIPLHKPCDLKL